ncbi:MULTISPECIES: class I adenylate-forming enzyme family protein [unclassified Pseudofrankia]|uniref:class I adenylate-forming enzyme family protein n=1 Tax=unclassified Pseudofrankia TaxID=2994372 RepID=UPI0008DA4DC7|nr:MULTISPECIES: AMP-binding protein [unclassified Pseudofrankia]MDT3443299.1 AMP-binding protein [Pseudofrankia sp. BMG5.37]OHV65361.1 feruloyl-CoA synthetase [Pseudofrankia sp. BMG5.36]
MDVPEVIPVGIGSRIRQLGVELPDVSALWCVELDGTESSYTWAWLDRRSSQLAAALAARGVGVGDRLGLGLRNSPQFVLAAFAAWKVGAVPVPVRWDVPDWELARVLEVIAPKAHLGAADLDWIDATEGDPVPDLPEVTAPHLQGICSSGSTGLPKVIVAERPAVYDVRMAIPMIAAWRPVAQPQTILVLAPMYHANGFTTLYNLLAGDRLVVLSKFDAAKAVDAIERHRISHFTAAPTMLQRMADLPGVDGRDFSSVEWVMQGAAPMPPSLVHRWAKLIGPEKLFMIYGMTEGLGWTALFGDEWMGHQGSVGRGIRGTEIRILDPEGDELRTGQIGDVYLRCGHFGGYQYLGTAPRLRTTDDGFVTAGDMGHVDEDGYLYLADRRVDMIITGGANVFPAEVEAALIDHPAIADVVVIGLRDEEWGRRVHALVEPTDRTAPPAEAEIIAYAKSRLAAYKVPKTIEFLDAIPRSEATKINRGALVAARGG